jgi:hypothetical protein
MNGLYISSYICNGDYIDEIHYFLEKFCEYLYYFSFDNTMIILDSKNNLTIPKNSQIIYYSES